MPFHPDIVGAAPRADPPPAEEISAAQPAVDLPSRSASVRSDVSVVDLPDGDEAQPGSVVVNGFCVPFVVQEARDAAHPTEIAWEFGEIVIQQVVRNPALAYSPSRELYQGTQRKFYDARGLASEPSLLALPTRGVLAIDAMQKMKLWCVQAVLRVRNSALFFSVSRTDVIDGVLIYGKDCAAKIALQRGGMDALSACLFDVGWNEGCGAIGIPDDPSYASKDEEGFRAWAELRDWKPALLPPGLAPAGADSLTIQPFWEDSRADELRNEKRALRVVAILGGFANWICGPK